MYQGRPAMIGTLLDITERRRLEELQHALSITDELTGLHNRRGFFTLAQQQMKVSERSGGALLLFFVDLDDLKHINDTFGHLEGDKALIEVSNVLRDTFRESDIIGRIGGDEFAVLAIETSDLTEEALITRLRDAIDTMIPEK
jgi:diguanylate cyclase (GGDEF)-like protein